jgi:hypothetical protein
VKGTPSGQVPIDVLIVHSSPSAQSASLVRLAGTQIPTGRPHAEPAPQSASDAQPWYAHWQLPSGAPVVRSNAVHTP